MLIAAVALTGLAAVAWLMPRHPVLAIGVVFMLAALSRVTLELPVGTMRLEQPALAGLIALTIWHRRALDLPPLRPLWPIIAAGLVYLGTLTASSVLVAPEPLASLRLVAWTALSMAGGLTAALLLAGRAQRGFDALARPAAVVATIGLLSAIGYVLFEVGSPWINSFQFPRVNGFALEPNLYASLLAAAVPLALERWRARPSLAALATALVLLLAMGLGVTRGAYIGLAAGLIVYFGLVWLRTRQHTGLRVVAVVVLIAGAIGLLLPKVLLNPDYAGVVAGPPPSSAPSPRPSPPPDLDTLEFRMIRVRQGLADWQASPWIGLGAYSYSQRHDGQYMANEVIAVWPVLTLHDAGLIGLGALLVLLGLLGLRLWRTAGDSARGPTASAYAAAVVVLLVAYLATTALHFALTWLIFGGALAATTNWPRGGDGSVADSVAGPAWRLTAPLTARSRRRRFEAFMRLMTPRESDRVLDVGITNKGWRSSNFLEALYPWPSRITAVAPADAPDFTAAFPEVRLTLADGRALPFADREFDIGFSNAVIEHVGSREEQRRFVAEIVRTCRRVFVCTPNRGFPIDPHTLLPFAHWLPRRWWYGVLRWTGNAQWASESLLNPLSARDLESLFPAGTNLRIERQRLLGLTSVLIAVAEAPEVEAKP